MHFEMDSPSFPPSDSIFHTCLLRLRQSPFNKGITCVSKIIRMQTKTRGAGRNVVSQSRGRRAQFLIIPRNYTRIS